MNEIVNKLLSAGDKFMPEIYLRLPGFTCSSRGPFKKKKKFKETSHLRYIIKENYIKLLFNMTWLMEILKIYLKEQLLEKHSVIKHLVLLKIQNMMNIKEVLLQSSINVLIKKVLGVVLKIKKN